jgi:hypothetical protein
MKIIGLPREAGSHPAASAARTPREATASLMWDRPFANPLNRRFQHGLTLHILLAQGYRHAPPALRRGLLGLAQEFPIIFEAVNFNGATSAKRINHIASLA